MENPFSLFLINLINLIISELTWVMLDYTNNTVAYNKHWWNLLSFRTYVTEQPTPDDFASPWSNAMFFDEV